MEMLRVEFSVMAVFALVLAVVVPSIHGQSLAPEPAPAPGPTSDGLLTLFSVLCLSVYVFLRNCSLGLQRSLIMGEWLLILLLQG
jgi:hypothetical protein